MSQFSDDTRPDPPPRGLLMLAAAWILLSLLIAFGTKPPILPLASSYGPAIRVAIIAMAAGVVVGWPLLRLTLPARRWPRRGVLLDLAVILGAIQVSVWPMRLAAGWSIERTLAIDACLGGWALVAAVFCLWGSRTDARGTRTSATVLLLALLLGPPLVGTALAAEPSAWIESRFAAASEPFLGLHRLADPASQTLTEDDRLVAAVPLVVGAIVLIASLPFTGPPRRR